MANERESEATDQSRYVQIAIVQEQRKWPVKYEDQDRVCADRANARKIAIQLAARLG